MVLSVDSVVKYPTLIVKPLICNPINANLDLVAWVGGTSGVTIHTFYRDSHPEPIFDIA
jgi:hypothetical protein